MKYCPQCRQSIECESDTDTPPEICPVCGSPLTERNLLQEGTDINGFSIVREIGHGGMGVVYLAKQKNLERYVAVKVLEDSLTGDREFVDGFFREARAAASLSHPNIVQAYDAGITADGIYFFVMELIDGMNLDQYVTEHGAMDLSKGLEIASKISDALKYSWESQNLCHGDIKPENIILKSNGEMKLADLGLARDYRKDKLRPGEIMATPAYAPPEVIRAECDKLGFKSDMYSFGATLYHIFSGTPPFPGDDPVAVCELQLNSQPKPLIALNAAIPSRLSILVDHLMEKSPANRPESWGAVCDEINLLLEAFRGPEDKKNDDGPTNLFSIFRSRPKLLLAASVALLFLLALCFYAIFCLFIQNDTNPSPAAFETVEFVAESPSDMAERSARSKAKARWNRLKNEIAQEGTETAIQKIRQYIRECNAESPNCAPEEAGEKLAFLSKKMAFETGKRTFITLRNSLLADCRAKKGLRNNSTKREIENQLHKLHVLFSRLSLLKKQNFTFRAQEDFITPEAMTNLRIYQDDLKKWSSHLDTLEAQKEKERLEKEKKQAETVRLLKNKNRAANQFSAILQTLDSVNTEKEARAFLEQIQSFDKKNHPFLSQNDLDKIQLLSLILQPDAFESEHVLFAKMKRLFVNEQFAPDAFPGKVFADTTEKGFVFYEKDAPHIQRLIPWDELHAKKKNLFCDMCRDQLEKMTSEEQHLFFRIMLLKKKNPVFCKKLLADSTRIPKAEKERLADAMNLVFPLK